jgi:hypothetical protein
MSQQFRQLYRPIPGKASFLRAVIRPGLCARQTSNERGIPEKAGEQNMAVQDSEKPTRSRLDLIDTILVLALSSAVVIFLLWISSRFLEKETFERLPGFVTDFYSALWAAGIAGSVGIGGAIVKHILEKQKPDIDYLRSTFLTVFGLLAIFISIIGLAIVVPTVPCRPDAPPNTIVIDFDRHSGERDFTLSSPLNLPIRFFVNGTFSIDDGGIKLRITSWRFEFPVNQEINENTRPNLVAIFACRAGNFSTTPGLPSVRSSIPLIENEISFVSGVMESKFAIPRSLEISRPEDARRSTFFLCAFIASSMGLIMQAS